MYEGYTGPSEIPNDPDAVKEILVEVRATADDTNTVAVDVADFGLGTVDYVLGWDHTVANSVLLLTAPTTTVAGTVLTITIGGSTDNLQRTFIVGGRA